MVYFVVSDADNDVVICRWATEQLDECGGICNAVHGIDIDEVSYMT